MSVHSPMSNEQRSVRKATLTFYVYHDTIKAETVRDVKTSIVLSAPIGKDSTKSGQDQFIAATALHYHLTLITRNVRDYDHVPHLKLYLAS
jgi:predicted nucleic acid-binding protein